MRISEPIAEIRRNDEIWVLMAVEAWNVFKTVESI